jgi:DUF4097 and DUF4098 domain-containing protein YvlB
MRHTLISAAALVLAIGSPAAAARAERTQTETVDRTVALAPGGTLKLNNFSGRVTITGVNRGNATIHAVRRATRERLDAIHLSIEERGDTVVIEANKRDGSWSDRDNNVVETDFDIEVPTRTNLDLHVFSSDISVTGVEGKANVKTFSGEVTLTGYAGSIDAETFSGDIEVNLSPSAAIGHIDFESFSGDLKSDLPLVLQSGRRRHVVADVSPGGSDTLHAKTFSGDVRIRK